MMTMVVVVVAVAVVVVVVVVVNGSGGGVHAGWPITAKRDDRDPVADRKSVV